MRRTGFALITVLWVLVAASAIGVAGSIAGADAAAAHRNRVNATRARWYAHGCANRVRSAIDIVLAEAPTASLDSVWRTLDALVDVFAGSADTNCTARLAAAGSRLNVNTASREELERLFTALGLAEPAQLAAATLDWVDADDAGRELGAEAPAYSAANRRTPRNGPIADVAELRYVMGLEGTDLDSVLSADSARISFANAPLPVLASLPGFGTEALARVVEWRAIGRQFTNMLVFAESLSPTGKAAIIASYPELTWRTTIDPEAWYIQASASVGSPPIQSSIRLKLIRADRRAVVVQRMLR